MCSIMSSEFQQETHRMAIPSNGITPAVIRKFIRHIPGTRSMMTRTTETNLLPFPLSEWVGVRGPATTCCDSPSASPRAQPAREAQKPHRLPLPRVGDAVVQHLRDPPPG